MGKLLNTMCERSNERVALYSLLCCLKTERTVTLGELSVPVAVFLGFTKTVCVLIAN